MARGACGGPRAPRTGPLVTPVVAPRGRQPGQRGRGPAGLEPACYRAHRRGAWRSLVSALVWGTRGPEFESRRPDSKAPQMVAFCIPAGYAQVESGQIRSVGDGGEKRVTAATGLFAAGEGAYGLWEALRRGPKGVGDDELRACCPRRATAARVVVAKAPCGALVGPLGSRLLGNDRSPLARRRRRRLADRVGSRLPVDRRLVRCGRAGCVAATACGACGRAHGRHRLPLLRRTPGSTGRLVDRPDGRPARHGLLDDRVCRPAPRLSAEPRHPRPSGRRVGRCVRDPTCRRPASLAALPRRSRRGQRPRLLSERSRGRLDRQGPARAPARGDALALPRPRLAVVARESASPPGAPAGARGRRDDAVVRGAARAGLDQRHEVTDPADGDPRRAGDRPRRVRRRPAALAPRSRGDRRSRPYPAVGGGSCRAPCGDRTRPPRSVGDTRLLAAGVRDVRRPRRAAGQPAGRRRTAGDDADRPRGPSCRCVGARPVVAGRAGVARRGDGRRRNRDRERAAPRRPARAPGGGSRLARAGDRGRAEGAQAPRARPARRRPAAAGGAGAQPEAARASAWPTRMRGRNWTSRSARSISRSPSCATSRAGSIPLSSPATGSRSRSSRWPHVRRSPFGSPSTSAGGCRSPSRSPPITSSPRA